MITNIPINRKKIVNKIIYCFSENSPELIFECANKNCDYTESRRKAAAAIDEFYES